MVNYNYIKMLKTEFFLLPVYFGCSNKYAVMSFLGYVSVSGVLCEAAPLRAACEWLG